MNQVYLQNGRTFIPTDPAALNVTDALPPGTYTVSITQAGYQLERVENFDLPAKRYGSVDKMASRIVETFLDRPSSTGVLLSGQKGSGKTMLAKRIAQLARETHGMITLLINQPLFGEAFNTFLQRISQPVVVLFDEFEKIYDRDEQSRLLTIFDGTFPSRKLFILTCNDRYRIDTHMHNRPGRLFYALDFVGLEKDFIVDYCQDNLKNAANLHGVLTVSSFFSQFSFDMLKALVEEMNRYDETATEAMQMLNMQPQNDASGAYTCKVFRHGKEVVGASNDGVRLDRTPLSCNGWEVTYYPPRDGEPGPEGCVDRESVFVLEVSRLVAVNPATGSLVFDTEEPGTQLHFTREAVWNPAFNFEAY